MRSKILGGAVSVALFSLAGMGRVANAYSLSRVVLPNGDVALAGLRLTPPAGWKLHQDAIADGTLLLGFASGDDYVTIYVRHQTGLNMRKIFANDVSVERYVEEENHGDLTWQNLLTSKTTDRPDGRRTLYMNSFMTEVDGFTFYGYSRSASRATAVEAATAFLEGTEAPARSWLSTQSLTVPDYTGKKYYLGFGDELDGFMGNEVKYDIAHTHDIFTTKLGGDYLGTELVGAGHGAITRAWKKIREKMTRRDMYVQYSSGHGSHTGLFAGVSYREIRDNALSLPAKEVIIFTMACYSGNLVASFNEKKDEWSNWGEQGRTLMVMASSQPEQASQTGPGTDDDENAGEEGSAGSAFGHALWKALIGYADGYVDGVKDGFISLGEIREFTSAMVSKLSQDTQNPVVTGVFNPGLIMNRVPSASYVESLRGQSTEGMSDAQVEGLIQRLNRELAVH